MQYTINQLYQDIYQRVFDIRDIFNNFFGEEFVDLQLFHTENFNKTRIQRFLIEHFISSSSDSEGNELYDVSTNTLKSLKDYFDDERVKIYVWWPTVTVTNENGKSIDIQDLYAKIVITVEGRIPYEYRGFLLNRATYNSIQFINGYLHSHIQYIPKDDFTRFMEPCLGTGPIYGTIGSLKNEYDETTWMLFCQELSMYVTVESLRGGPWKRLESIGDNERCYYNDYSLQDGSKYAFNTYFSNDILKDFITYYLKHGHLSLSYKNACFIPGMTFLEYTIDVSNAFIDYYNKFLKSTSERLQELFTHREILQSVVINNGRFYRKLNNPSYIRDLNRYRNKHVLTFKGRDIRTTITECAHITENCTIVLGFDITMYILSSILKIINFRYKNEHNNNNRTSEETTRACQKAYYI